MAISHGDPIWVDLGTNDVEASKTFYAELFGWNFTSTGPDFHNYEIIDNGGQVGGLGINMDPEGNVDTSMPVFWTVYFAADDIDATLKQVTANGGKAYFEPMQIGDMGKMVIAGAPSGAAFGLWQPGTIAGFDTSGSFGSSVWHETMTKDYPADLEFYSAVFGWDGVPMSDEDADEGPDNGGGYATNYAGESATAGICEANAWLPDDVPSYWRVYFRVEDTDATVAKIKELEGSLLDGPIDSPFGRVATVSDNLGGSFQIVAG